ncbi:MAG: protein kinase [Sandaracinaceae bacterium]
MSEPSTTAVERDRWVGHTVDDAYEIEARIGEGAMGRVYRAEDVRSGAPVALKILHKHLGGDPRIARRFHREAEAARRLSHPNSLEIRDFGQAKDGTLYIAMELLEGEDLQTVIDHDHPFTPRRIGFVMGQMLAAVHEAHRAGIIHRDLKPENVVLTPRDDAPDRVTVCDFGMAKIIESEGRSTAITKDGYVCGTPEYMAPEQAKGEPLDVRADVYAAGVILFQMLTGEVPFKAETALGLITKHIMDPPPRPRAVRPDWGIPRSLEKVALRALAKAPEDRFDDAADLARALRVAVEKLGKDADQTLGTGPFVAGGPPSPSEERERVKAAPRGASEAPAPHAEPSPTRWLMASGLALLFFGASAAWLAQDPAPPVMPRTPPTVDSPPSVQNSAAVTAPPSPLIEPDAPTTPAADTPAAPESPPAAQSRIGASEIQAPLAPAVAPPRDAPPLRPRRPERAAPIAEPATPADPGREALEAGRAHLLRGELGPALTRLAEAARLRPRDAAVQRELGRAAVRAGDVPRGVASYRRYLVLSPNAPDRAVIERIIAQHEG